LKSDVNGVLLVDKDAGETSFDVVRKVRRAAGVRKAGHAGTLDPFSTGLVVLMLGQATRLSQYLMFGNKRYLATLRLGVETETYDPEGRITLEREVPSFSPEDVETALDRFKGEIEQVPPAFSAVHVDGKRAYRLARKGMDVELRPRRVVIHEIRLLSMDLPEVTVDVVCSPGTYLRSLAFDLGRLLGVGAHVRTLRRISSGSFHVGDAVPSGRIAGSGGAALVEQGLIPLARALPDAPEVHVSEAIAARIRNGYKPKGEEIFRGASGVSARGGLVRLLCDGELIAVIETAPGPQKSQETTKNMRVFH